MNPKKSENPIINMFRTEWEHLGNRKKTYLVYMSFFVIAALIDLSVPLFVGKIFNLIQQEISSNAELFVLIKLILFLLVLRIAFWIFHGVARVMEQFTGFKIHKNYTNLKIKKVLELPVKWHKDHHSGDTIDKINRGRNSLDSFSQNVGFELIYSLINIVGALVILFFVDFKIGLFALVFCLVMIYITTRVDKKLRMYYLEINRFSNKLSSSIFDYLSNIVTVITLRLKKVVSKEVDKKLEISYNTHKKSVVLNEIKWALASTSIMIMTVLVLSYRAYTEYILTGAILIGTLYILYSYLEKVGKAFFRFASLYGKIMKLSSRVEGGYAIDEEFETLKHKIKTKMPKDWKHIDLKNVNFAYDADGNTRHVNNTDLKFNRGEKIALIGESGSGKSTILSLMRGLYAPDSGEVYCDNVKLKDGFSKLKQHITLIPQDPEIFNDTIGNNITMRFPVGKDEVNKAVSMAQFSNVANRLDNGLNTNVLEKGVSLSGGEKQRLALARGILAGRDSDIILLDEPTSSVDSLNEKQIHKNIFKEFENKTIISSIHRLHLLDNFDYIYMFDKGKIVAQGTFEEMKNSPEFAKVWKRYVWKK